MDDIKGQIIKHAINGLFTLVPKNGGVK